MTTQLERIAREYYIGSNRPSVRVEYSRAGARVTAEMDVSDLAPADADAMSLDLVAAAAEDLTWDQIENPKFASAPEIESAAHRVCRKVVLDLLPRKPRGVTYCDGSY